MAAGKEAEENDYRGSGLVDHRIDGVLDHGDEDDGAEDMGSLQHIGNSKGKVSGARFSR